MASNRYSPFPSYKENSRARHINSYIHTIIQFIKNYDRPLTFDEIEKNTNLKLTDNKKLLKTLTKNPKIVIGDNTLLFKPLYNIRNEKDLENIMVATNCEYGIELEKLLDSPIDIKPFVQNLQKKAVIFVLKDIDNSEIVFYNKSYLPPANDKIVELYNKIKIPNYQDVLKELSSAGIKVERKAQEERRNIVVKKTKIKKYKRKIKITNTHVKELNFNDLD